MITLLLALLLAGCGEPSGKGPPAAGAVPVQVELLAPGPFERTLVASGTVEAVDSTEIRAERAGLVEAVLFGDGEQVRKGQVLVRLRAEEARANLLDAEARQKLASLELERRQGLFDRGDVAQADLDRAVADEALARAALQRAREDLRRTTLLAPFDGVTGKRQVSVGELVDPSRVLTRVEGLGELVVEASFPEDALATVATEQRALVTVEALGDGRLPAAVRYVASRLEARTRTVEVRVGFDQPDPRLRPGMSATIRIVTADIPNALLVSSAALVRSATGDAVYTVAADGTAGLHPVKLGERTPDQVEVLEGLSPGDAVVIEGLARLRPGVAVEVVSPPASGDAP